MQSTLTRKSPGTVRMLFAVVLLSISGCGSWPPVVDDADDVNRLSASARSVRARGLSDEDVYALGRLKDLVDLDFGGGWGVMDAKLTDKGLATIAHLGLDDLDQLSLGWCVRITDEGMNSIEKFPSLSMLFLMGNPNLTDEGLRRIVKLESLVHLDLRGCPGITDASLLVLAEKKNWDELNLDGCLAVTGVGVEDLIRRLPGVRIRKNDDRWDYYQGDTSVEVDWDKAVDSRN